MAKVFFRISKRQGTGDIVFEGTSQECTDWLIKNKEELIESFLENQYNATVAASECFICSKENVTEEMRKSDELLAYMRIYFESYYRIYE